MGLAISHAETGVVDILPSVVVQLPVFCLVLAKHLSSYLDYHRCCTQANKLNPGLFTLIRYSSMINSSGPVCNFFPVMELFVVFLAPKYCRSYPSLSVYSIGMTWSPTVSLNIPASQK